MDGVAFKHGWLSRMYESSGLTNNLRLLFEKEYKWKKTTPDIPNLLTAFLQLNSTNHENIQRLHRLYTSLSGISFKLYMTAAPIFSRCVEGLHKHF